MKAEQLYTELHQFTDELLQEKKQVKLTVGGSSMFPVLKSGDEIVIEKWNPEDLKIGDVVVFKNAQKWVAHRVHDLKKESNNSFLITKGDSCKQKDKPILHDDFIGKVTSFYRKGKQKQMRNTLISWLIIRFPSIMTVLIRALLWFVLRFQKYRTNVNSVIKNLKFISQSSPKYTIVNVAISLFLGMLPFVIIFAIKKLIDSISRLSISADKTDAYQLIFLLIVITGVIFLIQTLLSIIGSQTRVRLSQSISRNIYNLIHGKYASLDMAHLEDSTQQDKIFRAVQEAGFRPMKMANEALGLIQSLTSSVIICALLLSIHWGLIFILIIAITPSFLLKIKHASKLHKVSVANSEKEREMNYYSRILTGLPFAKELRLFNLKDFFTGRFNNIQEELYQEKNSLNKHQAISEILAQCFAITMIFVSFGYVAYLSINGAVKIGTVVMFFLVIQRGFSVMKDFFQSVAGLFNDNVYFNDFFEFINLPNIENKSEQLTEVVPIQQAIKIENISFKYPSSQRFALKSLSLNIPKGKTVALVGANGSGKSTLIKLLCGFYTPDSGKILFDEINISNVNSDCLRTQISAVFQDFALYNLSVNENISMGNIQKEFSLDQVKQAARDAGMDEIIESLPLGYENILGNLFKNGEELSIGQWQKIAIAKAFYRNAPILLMDEPMSALDPETELQILKKLKELSENKTTLIVSHRFSTIQWVDCIYVMDNGTIVESGSHNQLMALKGKYCSLYNSSKFEF